MDHYPVKAITASQAFKDALTLRKEASNASKDRTFIKKCKSKRQKAIQQEQWSNEFLLAPGEARRDGRPHPPTVHSKAPGEIKIKVQETEASADAMASLDEAFLYSYMQLHESAHIRTGFMQLYAFLT